MGGRLRRNEKSLSYAHRYFGLGGRRAIQFFKYPNSTHALFIDNLLTTQQIIYTCPIIYQEVLQGIRQDSEFQRISADFLTYDFLLFSDPISAAEEAASIYRICRKKGVTIRKANDCLIAHYALYFQVPLLHHDSDFNQIASVFPLRTVKV